MSSPSSTLLVSAIAEEIRLASTRSNDLFSRRTTLSVEERAEMYGLWDYEKRLALIQALLAIARPDWPTVSVSSHELEVAFRDAVVRHGSATDDNVAAASAISLRANEHEVSFQVGHTGVALGRVLLEAVDVIGTGEFFAERLAQEPEFSNMTPELWEHAYRALMLQLTRC